MAERRLPGLRRRSLSLETHYLRVHVAHIRAKLEADSSRPQYLITEPGVGYRLAIRLLRPARSDSLRCQTDWPG